MNRSSQGEPFREYGILDIDELIDLIPPEAYFTKMNHRKKLIMKSYCNEAFKEKLNLEIEDFKDENFTRMRVYRKNNYRCALCGIRGNYISLQKSLAPIGNYFRFNMFAYKDSQSHHTIFTLDHFIPLAKSGKSEYSNLNCMCYECNAKKADHIMQLNCNSKRSISKYEKI